MKGTLKFAGPISAESIESLGIDRDLVIEDFSTGTDVTLTDITTSSLNLTQATLVNIVGIVPSYPGQKLLLRNKTTVDVTINNDSSAAAATHKIFTGTGADVVLLSESAILLQYDDITDSYWNIIGAVASVGGSGATTELDNLTTTAINADLIFNKATAFIKGTDKTGSTNSESLTISNGGTVDGNGGTVTIRTEIPSGTGVRANVAAQAKNIILGADDVAAMEGPTRVNLSTDNDIEIYPWSNITPNLKLYEGSGTFGVKMKASNSLAADYTLTLPLNDGASGEILSTDGSGVLSWIAPGGGSTFSDSAFRIQDNGNATKQIAFEASSISASTTRTITMPDANVNLGSLANLTLSNITGVGVNLIPTSADYILGVSSPANQWVAMHVRRISLYAFSDGLGEAMVMNATDSKPFGDSTPLTIQFRQNGMIYTPNKTSTTVSNDLLIGTGNTEDGASGGITIRTGVPTGSGARGSITLSALFMNLPTGSSDPTGVVAGSCYYNTSSNKIKFYNGSTWETITSL